MKLPTQLLTTEEQNSVMLILICEKLQVTPQEMLAGMLTYAEEKANMKNLEPFFEGLQEGEGFNA